MKYYLKAYAQLIIQLLKHKGKYLPYHSKTVRSIDDCINLDKKYLHNGIWNTVKAIARRECRIHWLKN